MNPEKELTTEERIIRAAEEVFTAKGKSGARMKEIAGRAGINQALLHYYFRSKDKLFEEVFERVVGRVFPGVFTILGEEIPFFEKIEKFIHAYMDAIEAHPELPMFIIKALGDKPDRLAETIISSFRQQRFDPVESIRKDVELEIEAGRMIEIDPRHLMVNIISISVFPFIARPMISRIAFPKDADRYDGFLDERKKHVPKFIINAIRKG